MNIGLENVSVAAARVVELPPRCSIRWVKSVDVYKTSARIIFYNAAEAQAASRLSPAFNAPKPHRASSVWRNTLVAHATRHVCLVLRSVTTNVVIKMTLLDTVRQTTIRHELCKLTAIARSTFQ